MKQFWLIETYMSDGTFTSHMVEASSYSEACAKLIALHGEAERKLLGIYEKSEVDKKILNRIK